MPLALALTPHGRLLVEESDDSFPVLEAPVSARITSAFACGTAPGLVHLATVELDTVLPASFSYWRDFGRLYVIRLCQTPGIDDGTATAVTPPSAGQFADMLESAPP